MTKHIYLSGGCFWCIAGVFQNLPGVLRVVSGYSGGEEKNPTYEEVKKQHTGHRETICVDYDDRILSPEKILDLFFENVDPFDGGGQFIDRGSSYTLAVLYEDPSVKEAAEQKIRETERKSGKKVFVSVEPFLFFCPAEEYHQNYAQKHPEAMEQELIVSGRKKGSRMDIEKLLKEMTLKEKLGQMTQLNCSYFHENKADITGPTSPLGMKEEDCAYVGSVLNFDNVTTMLETQKAAMEQQPHHIPLLFMMDVIHGYRTIYPIPLGMGATFDENILERCCHMAATEAASNGVMVTFGPMIDLARDARWGRVMETTGEDPYLNSRMAGAQVRGYQGDNLLDDDRIAACVKHFAAYGAAEAGRDYNSVEMTERTLREFYLKGYKGAVDAGVKMVMTSYNTIGGVPSTGSHHLFTDILRNEWGFQGTVISDYNAYREMIRHGVTPDEKGAAEKAIGAGCEIEMMSATTIKYAEKLLQEGKITMDQIDNAVRHILTLKNDLGLFEHPYAYASEEHARKNLLTEENRLLAREAAEKSAVLLKNKKVLPFSESTKKIAVIGPFADEHEIIGGWAMHGRCEESVSVLEGIQNGMPDAEITCIQGCTWKGEDVSTSEAVKAAKEAEAVILCLGEHQSWSGEGNSRAMLELPDAQITLARKVIRANKNTAVVLFSGRPLAITALDNIAPAILEVWQPGTEGGNAVSDLLFGTVSPYGRLPMSFPRCTGQEPIYYNHLPTARPVKDPKHTTEDLYISRYMDVPVDPLYVFGHGLTYTTFSYSKVKLDKKKMTRKKILHVSVKVRNKGTRDGNECVMLFIRDPLAEVSRPVKELKAYKRVDLAPGETKFITFEITNDMLEYVHTDLSTRSDAGDFEVFVGHDSDTVNKAVFTLEDES